MGYTKLFSTLITSTIWSEDDKTRIIWVTMLALADKHGEVHATIPGLARMAGVDVDAAESALRKFLSPDRYSRSQDDDGRRLEQIEGGWFLLNHRKYRDMLSAEDFKKANALRQARWRDRKKRNVTNNVMSRLSNAGQQYTEADAKADAGLGDVSPKPSLPPSGEKGRPKTSQPCDSDWIAELKVDPANEGIDVDHELSRARLWCSENRRKCTRKFFVRWLLKADRVIGETATAAPSSRSYDKGVPQ